MHLTPEQLIDIAEGTQPESEAPHLVGCDACRRQLADLRATLAAAADVDVPEPSPLFWDRFSERVHDAVAAEPAHAGWNWWLRMAAPAGLAAAAALLLAFVATTRLLAPHAEPRSEAAFKAVPPPAASPLPARETLADVADPSLALVADLAGDLDLDAAREAGLASRGSAEHAVTHLSEGELRRLRDLLQAELSNSGD